MTQIKTGSLFIFCLFLICWTSFVALALIPVLYCILMPVTRGGCDTIQRRELIPQSFYLFWTILHKYIPCRSVRWYCIALRLKPGLHLHANVNDACGQSRGRMYSTFVHYLAFAEAANRPYINVLYANSLWCTDSWQIALGCLPNIRRIAALFASPQ